jgi:hypothetical protein
MWQNAANSLLEIYKLARSTREERSSFNDTVIKLRRHPHTVTNSQAELICDKKEGTLFDSLLANHGFAEPARTAVRHWKLMEQVGPRQHEMTSLKASQQSNDKVGLGADETNLRFFLTNSITDSAKNKSLEEFETKSQAALGLSEDARDNLAVQAAEDLSCLESLTDAECEGLMLGMADCNDVSVRASLASNKRTPASVLWLLVNDTASDVKLGLIANTASPVSVIERLCRDADRKVSRKAQSRLRTIYKNEIGIASGNLSESHDAEQTASKQECSLDDFNAFFDSIAL